MADFDIIIIGAGAAGILAARELSKKFSRVAVLEARDRMGGRIHTLHDPMFAMPVELGAEFIHGNLPVTLALCKEYHIKLDTVGGEFWQASADTGLEKEDDIVEDPHHALAKALKELKEDMPIDEFLNEHLGDDKYVSIRQSVRKFVEGYDAADTKLASTFTFREEWLNMEEAEQYRIHGGYIRLINLLANDAKENGADIFLSTIVTEVHWKKNNVTIQTADKEKYTAKKLIITVPPPMLRSGAETGGIVFVPPIPEKIAAASSIGYGSVIKVIMRFERAFWKDGEVHDRLGKNLHNLGFVFSDEVVPTWWTQAPDEVPILTGWLAGPPAERMKSADDKAIFDEALFSLVNIFKDEALHPVSWRVINWANDPFTQGAYSFPTVNRHNFIEILQKPVDNTLFFSGEALHLGAGEGTVEAAFSSGMYAVTSIVGN